MYLIKSISAVTNYNCSSCFKKSRTWKLGVSDYIVVPVEDIHTRRNPTCCTIDTVTGAWLLLSLSHLVFASVTSSILLKYKIHTYTKILKGCIFIMLLNGVLGNVNFCYFQWIFQPGVLCRTSDKILKCQIKKKIRIRPEQSCWKKI